MNCSTRYVLAQAFVCSVDVNVMCVLRPLHVWLAIGVFSVVLLIVAAGERFGNSR